MKRLLIVFALFAVPATSAGQSFSRIITGTAVLGEMEHVYAVADLDGDGLDDIVVGDQIDHDPEFTPADRLTKTELHIFTSDGDGTRPCWNGLRRSEARSTPRVARNRSRCHTAIGHVVTRNPARDSTNRTRSAWPDRDCLR